MRALWPDGLRTVLGLLVTALPLMFLDVALPLSVILAGLSLLFLWFGMRLVAQWVCTIELSDDGISMRCLWRRFLQWRDIQRMRLGYYAPVRRRAEGWYQLTLEGGDRRLRFESTIDGFEHIVGMALRAADARNLTLDPATDANLAALGHRLEKKQLAPRSTRC